MTDRTMSAPARHDGPMHLGAAATPDWRTVAGAVVLCAAAIIFGYEMKSIAAINDWWGDEIFSLYAADPWLPFANALRYRILTDSNPPLYYVLLYVVRRLVADPRTAILVLNGLAIGATAVAVGVIGHRQRVLGFALAGFAAFLLSGPVLRFAVEGRSYLIAVTVAYVAAWLSALAVDAPKPRLAWWYWPALGVLGSLAHFFAGLFCGCLAAGLLVTSLLCRRRDLIVPALTLGIASSTTLILWFLAYGAGTTERVAWIVFSYDALATAALDVKHTIFGARFTTVPIVALTVIFLATLCIARTRPVAILSGVTAALFVAVPCALSLAQPIIQGRYWAIGAPIVVVFLTFVARSALSARRPAADRRLPMAACGSMVALLLVLDGGGFFAAQHMTAELPFWRGTPVVVPLLSHCGPASVHVNRHVWLFAVAARAPKDTFVDIGIAPPGWTDRPQPGCAVLGWAEHVMDPENIVTTASDRQLLDMLRIAVPLADVTILRHRTGYVVLRAHD